MIDYDCIFDFQYTVANIYDDPMGKYGEEWGNAAFVDCKYVFTNFLNSIMLEL